MDNKYNNNYNDENDGNEIFTVDDINNDETNNDETNNYSSYYNHNNNYQNENQNYNNYYDNNNENQTQFHSGYNYDSQNRYNNSAIVTTVEGKTVTPTISDKGNKKKPKNKSIFGRIVAFALVAVIAGSAGGSAAYIYMDNQNNQFVLQEKEEEKNTDNGVTNTGINSDGETGDISDLVEKAQDSVVEINTAKVSENPFVGSVEQPIEGGAGSGVVLTEDGYIVTNEHVVSGTDDITVRLNNGKEYKATLVGYDKQTDLAVLKIDLKDGEKLKPVTFADSDKIKVGDIAAAIGNPLGTLGGTVTEGIVSAKDRKIEVEGEIMTLLQTSAAVNPGNSGGGLFDSSGDLIGIVNAKSGGTNVEGLGFAIPSNLVKEVVNDIVNNGYVTGRPMLGIETIDISGPDAVFYYRVEEEGIYIAKNNGESDLLIGDKIVAVNGEEVNVHNDIKEALKNLEIGDTVKITVKRDGKVLDVNVVLTESKPNQ